MYCPCCQESYSIKENFLAKKCPCDEDERFISFSSWYFVFFGVNIDIIEAS